MRILLIKTSSLGDVIHTLPGLTDACKRHPTIQCDWLVEESYAQIPKMHPHVNKVIPIALRRWRKNILKPCMDGELIKFFHELRREHYDYIIDAQGLLKSAIVARLAHGKRHGLDKTSAREPLARFFYNEQYNASWQWHAVNRVRKLFANIFHYPLPQDDADYGLSIPELKQAKNAMQQPYLLFFHGTTWPTKHWPEQYWSTLTEFAKQANIAVKLPWGNATEQQRAIRIASQHDNASVLEKMSLIELAGIIKHASAVIAMDTGLGHLATALATPCISIYGPTNPGLTGNFGKHSIHLQADFPCAPCLLRECNYKGNKKDVKPPCYSNIPPEKVWHTLRNIIDI